MPKRKAVSASSIDASRLLKNWFKQQGWKPYAFQTATWEAYARGDSGLIHVPTGAGKTYAAYMGPLQGIAKDVTQRGLKILYITPLKAVSHDVEQALAAPLAELKLPISVESRTGDSTPGQRNRHRKRLPEVLVTTPESLSLLLSREDASEKFVDLRCVIVDEWHELLGSKRGTQVELALARLRVWAPRMQTWGMSATLSNLEEAAQALVGLNKEAVIIRETLAREIMMTTIIPEEIDAFPWAGHLGLKMMQPVLDQIDLKHSTLVFTNTRSQAERWYQEIIEARPDWIGLVALHHGSMDRKTRRFVEAGIKTGQLKVVVCTTSLDLGVDFAPVERVIQIGSCKGVARLMQRAGRSSHRPGAPCHIVCIPTHALELAEYAAAREALAERDVEPRHPLHEPLDVLIQHMMTCALGGGFTPDELYTEVRQTLAFENLSRAHFDWAIMLLHHGGSTLGAYPDFHRLTEEDGAYRVGKTRIARLHRLNIGTIMSNSSLLIRFLKGGALGTIEEAFVSRLKKGDDFMFAGRHLEFVTIHDMVVYVRKAKKKSAVFPRWNGDRLPFSDTLSKHLRHQFDLAAHGELNSLEMRALTPILDAQARLSVIPTQGSLLAETTQTRDGHHLFLYPFEGRHVHEGLAAVIAMRLAHHHPATFALSVNDYGIEFLTPEPFDFEPLITRDLFTTDDLVEDITRSCSMTELAKRQFREVARVSGLVFARYPGMDKSVRQIQASASLLFDVFMNYDPDNLLLHQAQREVLIKFFETHRLRETLTRLGQSEICFRHVSRPTPLAFPLIIERIGARLSTESILERVERMKRQWERVR